MSYCDLCNTSISSDATRFSASKMRRAAKAGLRPEGGMARLGAVFGMSSNEMHAGWLEKVMSDTTDWALCPPCAARVNGYLVRQLAVVLAVLLVLVGGAAAAYWYFFTSS